MNVVYTTLDNVRLKDGISVKSYKSLDEKYQKWIEVKTMELLKKRTFPELKLSSILKDSKYHIEEQAFFMIDLKGYFLDFFIPELNIAIELNGAVHRTQEAHDKDLIRDSKFSKIGITTIRITNRMVYDENFKNIIDVFVRAAKEGEFDASSYYDTPNCVKFNGKKTPFQTFLSKLDDILNQCNTGECVLLKTTETYLLNSLSNLGNIDKGAANKDYFDDILNTITNKGLDFHVCYIGKTRNLRGWQFDIVKKCNDSISELKFNRVLDGSEIYNCRTFRPKGNPIHRKGKLESSTLGLNPF